jgi:hypothetical protein
MNQLLQGDCLEVMRGLPDQSIGLVLAAPKPLMKQGFTPFLRYNGKTGQCFQHPRNGDLVSVGHMKILTFKEDSLEYLTEIKRLHEVDGLSLREISSIVGRDHHWVGRRIKKAGGAIQSKKERWKGYNFTCEFCEKTFQQNWKGRGRKFCSQDCYVNFNGRTRGIMAEKNCPECGSTFKPASSDQIRCSRKCFEQSHKKRMAGQNNPAWIDGRSKDPEHTFFRADNWDEIKQFIYNRDGYRCQSCGCSCTSKSRAKTPDETRRIIQCHHIKPFRDSGDNSPENLVTLCLSCHRSIHNNSEYHQGGDALSLG